MAGHSSSNSRFQRVIRHEAAGGALLFAAAVVALIWANSPWSEHYDDLWHTSVTIGTGRFHLTESLLHWINDGLMAIFFFAVGLEIKRELLVGELASPRRAALPAIAALGGVLVPAGIFLALNLGHDGADGWGIPMATDIAFVVGVLALLGSRIPLGLKVFLTALAIVDDIAAVIVIAAFYTSEIETGPGLWAAVFIAVLIAINRMHIRHPLAYGLLGIGLWVAVLQSGIHATVAGVLLALMIPARTRIDPEQLIEQGRTVLDDFARASSPGTSILTNNEQQEALATLEDLVEGSGAPLHRLEHGLQPWVTYMIVPLFALANAGVALEFGDIAGRVTLGVLLGLVLGKMVGITVFSLVATGSGLTSLPDGVTRTQVFGAACLAGIGFTMSLFVTDLAFGDPGQESLRAAAKIGILGGSLIAGVVGWIALTRRPRRVAEP